MSRELKTSLRRLVRDRHDWLVLAALLIGSGCLAISLLATLANAQPAGF